MTQLIPLALALSVFITACEKSVNSNSTEQLKAHISSPKNVSEEKPLPIIIDKKMSPGPILLDQEGDSGFWLTDLSCVPKEMLASLESSKNFQITSKDKNPEGLFYTKITVIAKDKWESVLKPCGLSQALGLNEKLKATDYQITQIHFVVSKPGECYYPSPRIEITTNDKNVRLLLPSTLKVGANSEAMKKELSRFVDKDHPNFHPTFQSGNHFPEPEAIFHNEKGEHFVLIGMVSLGQTLNNYKYDKTQFIKVSSSEQYACGS